MRTRITSYRVCLTKPLLLTEVGEFPFLNSEPTPELHKTKTQCHTIVHILCMAILMGQSRCQIISQVSFTYVLTTKLANCLINRNLFTALGAFGTAFSVFGIVSTVMVTAIFALSIFHVVRKSPPQWR